MITLIFIDEINAKFQGLNGELTTAVINATKIKEKDSHMTVAFKSGNWDGKTSFFTPDGFFFVTMLDDVLDVLESEGVDIENDITIEDLREPIKHPVALQETQIDETFLAEYGWHELYPHQVDGINAILKNEKGIIEVGTAGGKSGIMAAICKVYDPFYGSLSITKDAKLCSQLKETYLSVGLDVEIITSATPVKKREEIFNSHRHIITTNNLAMNMTDIVSGFQGVFLNDEIHRFGEQFAQFVKNFLGDCPIRVGLTGTLTEKNKDALKRAKIVGHVGGGPVIDVNVGELRGGGYVADFKIEMIEIVDNIGAVKFDEIGSKAWTWDHEESHLFGCEERIKTIAEVITKKCNGKNSLILCRPQVGAKISELLGLDFIDQHVKSKEREVFYKKFEEYEKGYTLAATFETTGTGLSIDRIFNVFIIDVGANPTYIGQGIGRGIRKDGVEDFVNVFDIHTDTKYCQKQKKNRIKYYKKKGYPFFESTEKFEVN